MWRAHPRLQEGALPFQEETGLARPTLDFRPRELKLGECVLLEATMFVVMCLMEAVGKSLICMINCCQRSGLKEHVPGRSSGAPLQGVLRHVVHGCGEGLGWDVPSLGGSTGEEAP